MYTHILQQIYYGIYITACIVCNLHYGENIMQYTYYRIYRYICIYILKNICQEHVLQNMYYGTMTYKYVFIHTYMYTYIHIYSIHVYYAKYITQSILRNI